MHKSTEKVKYKISFDQDVSGSVPLHQKGTEYMRELAHVRDCRTGNHLSQMPAIIVYYMLSFCFL
jgi:hypothetical protein